MRKETFISILNDLKVQKDKDLAYSSKLEKIFSCEVSSSYDNTVLVDRLILILKDLFSGFEDDIDRFVWELDFGRAKGSKIKSPEDLWEKFHSPSPQGFDYLFRPTSEDKKEE